MGKLVPIIELPVEPAEDEFLVWRMDLGPYVDAERIGVDVTRTRRVLRAAGFGSLVVRDYFGEQSEFDTAGVNVSGMNADGSAMGTASTSARKAQTEKSGMHQQSGEELLAREFRWPTAVLSVNRTEAASQVSDAVRAGKTREQAWAAQLNYSLRHGLRQAAFQKFKEDFTYFKLGTAVSFAMFGWNASIFAEDLATSNGVYGATNWITNCALLSGVSLMHNKSQTGDAHLRRLRLSAFSYGIQPDRMALGGLLAMGQRLVRPAKPGSAKAMETSSEQ